MASLKVNLPDPMKEFIDREVGTGRFKDVSAYVQLLIAEAMEIKAIEFTEEEKKRIEQQLLESLDSFEGGKAVPVHPGEFEDLAKRMVDQHQGRQAS